MVKLTEEQEFKLFIYEKLLYFKSGIYCYGVVTGEDDGNFYPAVYSKYTKFAKTSISDCQMMSSRYKATELAKVVAEIHLEEYFEENYDKFFKEFKESKNS
ncbi:MAG: hypothetical protein GY827_04710 [Cytophagales bacterium]|nr:hypothetical protein [Cytophagales bacterium]